MFRKQVCVILCVVLLLPVLLAAPIVSAEGLPFVDVKPKHWFYNSVTWAYENNVVSGMDDTHFAPNQPCTRAQIVTLLYGLAGKPEVDAENPFQDVKPRHYFYNAVLWAYSNGITSGVDDTHFGPNESCTRAQAVTFIWNYFGSPVCEPEVRFQDVKRSAYYYNAVNWAYSNGVTSGTDLTKFSPNTVVTRAMVVTFLFRMKHVIEGGEHLFTLQGEQPATCTLPPSQIYACECGNTKTVYSGEALGHEFYKATLVADATASTPTVYQLTCLRCGAADAQSNRSLGKPIYGDPVFQSSYNSHQWTEGELANGIRFTSTQGAAATITRRWFANAWCYICEIVLPEGAYDHFAGTNIVNLYGSNDSSKYLSAYNAMALVPEAQILFNGDTQLVNNRSTLRGGQIYNGTQTSPTTDSGAAYWNPTNGTFGTVRDLPGIPDMKLTTVRNYGVTDLFSFRALVKDGKMDMETFDADPDYDEASYLIQQNNPDNGTRARRQRIMIGFKKDADGTVHIFLAAADGTCYVNHNATNPSYWANDCASYGNSFREMMILMSTLGAEYATSLDGGYSVAMIIRRNGVIEQVNATDCSQKSPYSPYAARKLWDFIYFR